MSRNRQYGIELRSVVPLKRQGEFLVMCLDHDPDMLFATFQKIGNFVHSTKNGHYSVEVHNGPRLFVEEKYVEWCI